MAAGKQVPVSATGAQLCQLFVNLLPAGLRRWPAGVEEHADGHCPGQASQQARRWTASSICSAQVGEKQLVLSCPSGCCAHGLNCCSGMLAWPVHQLDANTPAPCFLQCG